MFVDINIEDNSRILEFFGIDIKEILIVRLINLVEDDMIKYKVEIIEVIIENVKVFVFLVFDGLFKVIIFF